MNILLIFFAIPLAVIIFSIALEKILMCPALVAGVIFSTALVITFSINDLNYLIGAIIYTILSYITATISIVLMRRVNCNTDINHQTIDCTEDIGTAHTNNLCRRIGSRR